MLPVLIKRTLKRRHCTVLLGSAFFLWNLITYIVLTSRPTENKSNTDLQEVKLQQHGLMDRLKMLERETQDQTVERQAAMARLTELLWQIEYNLNKTAAISPTQQHTTTTTTTTTPSQPKAQVIDSGRPKLHNISHDLSQPSLVVLPVLVIACNRPSINRNLDQLIRYRPSPALFPIVVSQDCGDQATATKIRSYGDQLTLIQHPDLSDIILPPKENRWKGYYKISRHYKWALSQIFHTFNYSAVIIVEDDLDISPDFFEYFLATFPLLKVDPTLWCISAWNDNGKADRVENNPELLHRTDFFPGLGWMLTKEIWSELEPKWPPAFWDDWIRMPEQRNNRVCIRPELSRTGTFGREGVSKGQFFDTYLKLIQLNSEFVPFTKRNFTYLLPDIYDPLFVRKVYSVPEVTFTQVLQNQLGDANVVRITYNTAKDFKNMAKVLAIMDDLKSGVPRTGYRGVVSIMHNGRRVYIAPPPNWTNYNPKDS